MYGMMMEIATRSADIDLVISSTGDKISITLLVMCNNIDSVIIVSQWFIIVI